MRRIRTSLSYEKRIGLPGAAGGIPVTDSIRRTLLLSVADTHLDDTLERAAGRLVKCDDSGSLLADVKFRGYSEMDVAIQRLLVDDLVTEYTMPVGWRHLEVFWAVGQFIGFVHVTSSTGNILITVADHRLTKVTGVIRTYYMQTFGMQGASVDVSHYYFK